MTLFPRQSTAPNPAAVTDPYQVLETLAATYAYLIAAEPGPEDADTAMALRSLTWLAAVAECSPVSILETFAGHFDTFTRFPTAAFPQTAALLADVHDPASSRFLLNAASDLTGRVTPGPARGAALISVADALGEDLLDFAALEAGLFPTGDGPA